MAHDSAPAAPAAPLAADADKRRNTCTALLVATAFFMENLDGTVITTAVPAMARDFGVIPTDLSLGVSAYLLTLGVFIPISGWMADRFGSRRVFSSALILFTLASLACALVSNLWGFVALRVLQGIGGAMMVPVGRLVLLKSTPKGDLMRVMSMLIWPGLFAPVLGPPLGGFITEYASWQWIFYLNIPIGIAALTAAWVLIPAEDGNERRPFDWTGFFWIGGGLTSLLWALELFGRPVLPWGQIYPCLAMGLAFLYKGIRHLNCHPHPMLSLAPIKKHTYAVNIWGGSLFRMSVGAVPFMLPLMFQAGYGMDAFRAGQLVLVVFAGNLTMKLFTTPVMKRFGFRRILLFNGVFNSLALAACACIGPDMGFVPTAIILFIGGLSRSMQFTALNTLAFADMPKEDLSAASSLFSTMSQLALGMGIALGAIAIRLGDWAVPLLGLREAPGAAYRLAFLFVALVSLLGMLDLLGLKRDAGSALNAPEEQKEA